MINSAATEWKFVPLSCLNTAATCCEGVNCFFKAGVDSVDLSIFAAAPVTPSTSSNRCQPHSVARRFGSFADDAPAMMAALILPSLLVIVAVEAVVAAVVLRFSAETDVPAFDTLIAGCLLVERLLEVEEERSACTAAG